VLVAAGRPRTAQPQRVEVFDRWNGGDGTGHIGLSGFWGNYLTATSSYSSSVSGALGPCCGVDYPAGDYGIFSSNATNGWFKHSYASNMADAAYYIGACQQVCDQVMEDDQGEGSARPRSTQRVTVTRWPPASS